MLIAVHRWVFNLNCTFLFILGMVAGCLITLYTFPQNQDITCIEIEGNWYSSDEWYNEPDSDGPGWTIEEPIEPDEFPYLIL